MRRTMRPNRALLAGLSLVALLLAAPGPAIAQHREVLGVETIQSQGLREKLDAEAIISHSGWYLVGKAPSAYRIGNASPPGRAQKTAAFLKAGIGALLGHGALERTIPAQPFAGERVAFTADVMLQGRAQARLWINILDADGRIMRSIGKDHLSGDVWSNHVLAAYIPQSASALEIGLSLWGSETATVWIDVMTLETVDDAVTSQGRDALFENGWQNPEVQQP